MNGKIMEQYPYLYETHLHTSESSACARSTGAEMARACKEYGYTGIFVTDHNWGGNTRIDRSLPWEQWIDRFCEGYEHAKAEGERIGLDVFFGCETGFAGTEFLLYGIDKLWMKSHPALRTATVEEQYRLVHEAGGLVMHAHPYREEPYIPEIRLFPEWVDGVEGINATHSNSRSMAHKDHAYDVKAVQYARKHGLPMSAGSDIHTVQLLGGGVAFSRRLASARDYVTAILTGEDYVLTDGEAWYDKNGNEL
ncbi:MAG: PHP domain-containing protein [Clostridiales bacterium]|nr:PHP domain-containing protein [Clostridiales bacterium]